MLGDVVNTAARLAALAGRDELLIRAALRERLDAGFACEPAGERVLPGAVAPLAVHTIVGRRDGAASVA